MLPDFLVIGAFKAGTTSLHQYFSQHPSVFMTRVKEPNFFAFDPQNVAHAGARRHDFPVHSLADYERLFDGAAEGAVRGEASPGYLHSPIAAERIHQMLPEAKLIVSLRSPVDRAFSHFQMAVRSGRSADRVPPSVPDDAMWFRASLYADALRAYQSRFGRERLRCVLFDRLSAQPQAVMRELFEFVGADPDMPVDTGRSFNPGGMPRHPRLYRLMQSARRLPGVASLTPAPLRQALTRLRDRSLQKSMTLDDATRRQWTAYYRPDIERTAALTGLDLGPWLAD